MHFEASPLYPILDAAFFPNADVWDEPTRTRYFAGVAEALSSAGVTLLQYRNKFAEDEDVLTDAQILRACAPPSLRIILNDRAHLVHAAGCDGVHVGQGDLPVSETRALLGSESIIGLSTHTEAQLRAGDATSADYLAIGPVFTTSTKDNAEPAVGLEGVRRARALTAKPLVAIGGITRGHAAEVWTAGADSLAVISALFGPDAQDAPLEKLAGDFLQVFR